MLMRHEQTVFSDLTEESEDGISLKQVGHTAIVKCDFADL